MRTAALLLLFATGIAPAATPSEALKLAPGPFNTVTVINVAAILRTPRAVKEKWAEKDHTEYLAGAIPFHPSVSSILATADFRTGRKGGGTSAVIAPMAKKMDLAAVAKAVGGEQTTAGGEPVVATRGGLYLLKLGDDLLGGMRADGKQDVGRWATAVREKKGSVASRYLATAVSTLGTNQIQIAVDVQDLYEPKDVTAALALSPGLADDLKTREAVGKYLAGLEGVRLAVNVSDSAVRLVIALDGTENPRVQPEVLKAVLVELIERAGAGLTDLRAATPAVEVNRFTLTLNVTDGELAAITSAVLPPPPPTGDLDKIAVASGAITKEATGRFVQAADRVIDDLKKKHQRADDYARTAQWHDAAANRLVSLPVIGVDPKAVEYAYGTAGVLHDIGESLRGVPVEAARLEQGAYYYQSGSRRFGWSVGWGWHFTPAWANGGGAVMTNLPEIWAKQAEVVKKDQENRDRLWKLIDGKRSELTGSLGMSK